MTRPHRIFPIALLLLLLLGGGRLSADEHAELRTDGPMPLADLLQAVQSMGVPLVWDSKNRAIQGREFVGPIHLSGTPDQVLDALRSLLTFYDLVLVPVGGGDNGMLLVVDARQTAAIVKLKPVHVQLDETNVDAYEQKDGLFVSSLIRLPPSLNVLNARNALARVVTGQNIGSVTEVSEDTLLVTDFAPNVALAWRLARTMEQAGGPGMAKEAVLRTIPLKNASAGQLGPLLAAHFGTEEAAEPKRPQGHGPRSAPAHPLRIHADTRTNQLLVSGPSLMLEEVARAVTLLDVPQPRPDTWVQVVRLAHVSASGAARTLGNLIARSGGGFGEGPTPVVEPHPETNALLLHGTPAALEQLRRVVTEMDVETAEAPK